MSAVSILHEQADAETTRRLREARSRLRLARASGLLDGLWRGRPWGEPRGTSSERRAYEQGYARGQAISEERRR